MLENLFDEFDLSRKEEQLYLCLLEGGVNSAGALAKMLNVPRATLYGHLGRLKEVGFITEIDQKPIKKFCAEPPDKLNLLYKQRVDRLSAEQQRFELNLPQLLAKSDRKSLRPRLRYFEGKRALQSMMGDMLLYQDNAVIYSFWPAQSMIKTLGEDYLTDFNISRIQKNISIKAIWPPTQVVDIGRYPFMGVGKPFLRQTRIAPEKINAQLSYMVYGDRVMVISSRFESYGFVVQSQDMAQMLIDQFMVIWGVSAPVTHPEVDGRHFLDLLSSSCAFSE